MAGVLTKWMWMRIIEGGTMVGGEARTLFLESATALPPTYIFRLNVRTSWELEHLFLACCSSWLLFNWISSSGSPACHCSQGLLTITGPTLSRRFRAKLITRLPFWLMQWYSPRLRLIGLCPKGACLCLHLWEGDGATGFISPSFPGAPCGKTEPVVASTPRLCNASQSPNPTSRVLSVELF